MVISKNSSLSFRCMVAGVVLIQFALIKSAVGSPQSEQLKISAHSPPVQMTLTGDIQKLVIEGKRDYLVNGKDSTFSQSLNLSFENKTVPKLFPVKVSLRGQTSVNAMPFPKLKVKGDDIPTFKLITHGWENDSNDIVGLGLLASPKAVYREASVYELLESLGFPLVKTQRAIITYVDTGANHATTQPALILETTGEVTTRLGGSEIDPLKITDIQKKKLAKAPLATFVAFAEIMIGNWDFSLPYGTDNEADIHNIAVVELQNGEVLPLMEDFNMSSAVTAYIHPDPHLRPEFHPDKSPLFRSMLFNLLLAKDQLTVKSFKQAVAYFSSKKEILTNAVEKADVDPDGRTILRQHVTTFFEVLTSSFVN